MPPIKTKRGGICIVCGEYVFAAETLEAHYKANHQEKK